MDRVQDGDAVVLHVNGDRRYVAKAKRGSFIKLGATRCTLDAIIGSRYGTLFGLAADGCSLQAVEHTPSAEWDTLEAVDTVKNNAKLIEDADNQQLRGDAIEEMRAAGKTGDEIVAALAASSKTFESKTEFAQEKYKKKKAKKYNLLVAVQRATAAAVCEALYAAAPQKVGHLRLDTLAVLLSLANVGAHARVLVIETCGGLLTAAVAERLGGYGSVHSAWLGPKAPSWDVWRQCAASDAGAAQQQRGQQQANVQFTPLAQLLERQAKAVAAEAAGAGADGSAARQQLDAAAAATADGGAQSHQQQQQEEALKEAAGPAFAPFTSCIVAAPKYGAAALLQRVLPLLAPSSAFSVFSPFAQPLAEALQELRSSGMAAGLLLQEGWWREQQVLPSRTHPLMTMDHGGGLVLSGYTLCGGGGGKLGGVGAGAVEGGSAEQGEGRKRQRAD